MKLILAFIAIFIFRAAHADDPPYFVGYVNGDAWIYEFSPDRWNLPTEMQLSFEICLNDRATKAAVRKKYFRVENSEDGVRVSNDIYETNDAGCFYWYEKFPLVSFPKVNEAVKVRRNIRALGEYSGACVSAEFIVDPDPMKPTIQNFRLVEPPLNLISETEYKTKSIYESPTEVFAKNILLQLSSVNWKANMVELTVDFEPYAKMIGSDGVFYSREIRNGAFEVVPSVIATNVATYQEWPRPTAEGASAVARVVEGHLLTTITIRLSSEGVFSWANYILTLRLTPTGFIGRAPVSDTEIICEMGKGLGALGFGNAIHECQLHPKCLEGTDPCSPPEILERK